MTRFVLAILVCICGPVPVLAQSSVLDFSKPATGKSRFAINPDGSPLKLGVPAQRGSHRQARSNPAAVRPCDGGSCGSGAERSAPPPVEDQPGQGDCSSGAAETSGTSSCEQTKTPASQDEAGETEQD